MQTIGHSYLRPNVSSGSEGSLWDFLKVVFRYKLQGILFFIVIVCSITVFTYMMPETYQSDAKLLIRSGRENLSIDPTVVGPTMSLFQKHEDQVNSELALLKSHLLIERVVDKIGPERFFEATDGNTIGKSTFLTRLGIRKSLSPRDQIIIYILENLTAEVEKKSHIINLSFQFSNPQLTRKTLNTVLDSYMERHIEVNSVQASPQFFKEQTDRLFAELIRKEAELEDFRKKHNISSVEKEKDILLEQINSLEILLNTTLGQIDSAKAQINSFQKSLAGSAHMLGFNAYKREIQLTMTKERANIQAAMAQKAVIANKVKELKKTLTTLGEHELIIKRSQRDIEITEVEYSEYRNNLQRSNISKALDKNKVSNVTVVQPATMPIEPIKPNKKLNIILSVFLGLFGGVGLAFFMEFLDDTLKTNEDVQNRLGLPILGTILHREFKSCT